jgi:HEAT repeat protein
MNGDKAKEAAPLFREHLKDQDDDVRYAAAIELSKLTNIDSVVVPALIAILLDEIKYSHRDYKIAEAATALGRLGPQASAAIPTLTRLTQSDFGNIKEAAQTALSRIMVK